MKTKKYNNLDHLYQELSINELQTINGGSGITWSIGALIGGAIAGFLNVGDDMRGLFADCNNGKPFPAH